MADSSPSTVRVEGSHDVAVPDSPSDANVHGSSYPASARPRRGIRVIVIVVAVAVILLVILALVPIPHSFSGTLASTLLTPARQSLTFPDGSRVSFSWSTTNGDSVAFDLVNSAGSTIYFDTAPSGSYTFTADGNAYLFESAALTTETVQFSGTYSIPLI